MLTCKEVSERATDFIERTLPRRTRVAVLFHVAFCRLCREYLRQMRATVALLRRLGQQDMQVPEATRGRLVAMFSQWRPPEASPLRTEVSLPGRLVSVLDRLFGGSRSLVALCAVLLASLILVFIARPTGGAPIPLSAGFMCTGMELAAGVLPLGAVVLLVRQGGRRVGLGVYAIAAGLGALVGQASIHLSCPQDGMRFHLLAFHFGGVVLALLLAAVASWVQPRPAAR